MNKRGILLIVVILLAVLLQFVSADVIERGANWDKFNSSGETFNLKIYNEIINYLNGSDYSPINTTIGSSSYSNFVYELQTPFYKIYFRNNSNTDSNTDQPVRFEKDGYFLVYDISEGQMQWRAQPGFPARTDTLGVGYSSNSLDSYIIVNNNIGLYPGAFSNTNVTYGLTSSMLKENFILSGLPSFKDYLYLEYTGRLYFNKTLKICANSQCYVPSGSEDDFNTTGKIEFKDDDNITHFYLTEPIVKDSNGSYTNAIYFVKGSNAQMGFDLRINKSFLETAAFPVYIDPSIKIDTGSNGGGDAYVDKSTPNRNYGESEDLKVQRVAWQRTYLKFNISSIPNNQVIDNATLCLYLYNDQADQNISINHVYDNSWCEGDGGTDGSPACEITWNNQPCGIEEESLNSSLCNTTGESKIVTNSGLDNTWQCKVVTNMVDRDYNSGNKSTSIVLWTVDSGSADIFYSKEYSDSSLWPYLNITYHLADAIAPNLAIISPLNQSYNTDLILVNISASDANLASVWWYNGSANLTYTSLIFYNFPQGSNTLIAYANDTIGNLNSTSITFYVDSLPPVINLIIPEAKTYGYNVSIPLNFSISDASGISSCWYNLNNGENITIAGCQNSTFNVSDGSYTLYLYANDSLGNSAEKNVSFSVLTTAPAINLIFPKLNYLNYQQIYFNYSISGVSVSYCELWGNWTGVWHLNQTNSMITQENNFFILNLTEGNYNWGIVCNDSQNRFSNVNSSFSIDTSSPMISITEPNSAGTYYINQDINLNFIASDFNTDSCWYNLTKLTGATWTLYGEAKNLINCSKNIVSIGIFDIGSYQIYLSANDSANNQNYTNSSFSVSTSGTNPPVNPPSGGGGGGGGSFFNATSQAKIEISGLSDINMKSGESKTLTISVKNSGNKFLNNCKLKGEDITSREVKGISSGEIAEFIFSISSPNEDKTEIISIECDETKISQAFKIFLIKELIELKIEKIEQSGKKLNFIYALNNFADKQDVSVEYLLLDEQGNKVLEGKDSFSAEKGEIKKTGELNLPSDLVGEYVLQIRISSQVGIASAQEYVLIGKSFGIVGRVLFTPSGGRAVSIVVIIILALAISIVIIKRIIKKPVKEDRYGYVKVKLGRKASALFSEQDYSTNSSQENSFFSGLKKSFNGFINNAVRRKRGVMVIDNIIVEHLKKHTAGKDLRGKWIHVNRHFKSNLINKQLQNLNNITANTNSKQQDNIKLISQSFKSYDKIR